MNFNLKLAKKKTDSNQSENKNKKNWKKKEKMSKTENQIDDKPIQKKSIHWVWSVLDIGLDLLRN